MKNMNTTLRLIAVHLGLASSVALGEGKVAGREEHPGTCPKLTRWTAVLALVIALAPRAACAQEDGTVTISGLFSMDYLSGELDLYYFDPDLLTVYNNGHEHTWMLTLHGTTQTHVSTEVDYVELFQDTEIYATSFDLEFFGPEAATLNSIVNDHLAGKNAWVFLRNHSSHYSDNDNAEFHVVVGGGNGELYFATRQYHTSGTLFPTDPDGYPVVSPEPFSIEPDFTELGFSDLLSGTGGAIGSVAGLVTFEGSGGSKDPPSLPTLNIGDASVVEGNRGRNQVQFTVSRSGSGEGTVSVDYRTVAGTALAKSDYSAASGTLTFHPGVWSHTITIAVKTDRTREPDETFTVELFNTFGGTVGDAVATGTILNDD
jgi:hypothetical protein